eukprot:4795410-Amphidinium_carterae.2
MRTQQVSCAPSRQATRKLLSLFWLMHLTLAVAPKRFSRLMLLDVAIARSKHGLQILCGPTRLNVKLCSRKWRDWGPLMSGLVLLVSNEIGTQLQKKGFQALSDWLQSRLQANAASEVLAVACVKDLVDCFRVTFCDEHMLRGSRVCFFKKAPLVVSELYHRFREEDTRFRFCDGPRLTAYDLASRVGNHEVLPNGSEDEVSLRAAAMVAVETVVEATDRQLTASELGKSGWAWTPECYATKDTVFY